MGPEILEIDGKKPYSLFENIRRVGLSPNGKRVAFLAISSTGTSHVVIDGRPDLALEELLSRIYFSEDSQSHFYTARIKNDAGEQLYVVIGFTNYSRRTIHFWF